MEEHNNYAVDFFSATKVIKETCPYAKISYLRLALPHTDACQASRTERKRAGLAATAAAHRAALRRAATHWAFTFPYVARRRMPVGARQPVRPRLMRLGWSAVSGVLSSPVW